MTKKQDWLYEDDDMMGESPDNDNSKNAKSKSHHKKIEVETENGDGEENSAADVTGELPKPDSYLVLEKKLNEAEELANENWDKFVRMQAELKNYQERARRSEEETRKYANTKILEEMVPILDSLEQGIASVSESDNELVNNMKNGMILTLQMFQKILAKFGVKELNPVNEVFNPSFHEVMLAQESDAVPPNNILSVFQKGYVLQDRLIRPARVMVAKASAKSGQ